MTLKAAKLACTRTAETMQSDREKQTLTQQYKDSIHYSVHAAMQSIVTQLQTNTVAMLIRNRYVNVGMYVVCKLHFS